MKSLDSKTLEISKYWLKHVFFPFAGRGSIKPCQVYYKDGYSVYDTTDVTTGCKALYEEITERKWKDLESILNKLSEYYFNYTDSISKSSNIKMSPTFVTNALAWMCKVKEIDWNDFSHTKQELDYFKRTSLGKALWNFECFTSQYVKAASTPENTQQTTSQKAVKNNVNKTSNGNNGNNSWKARGPLSSQVRDIVSVPGNKEYVNYSIIKLPRISA